MADFRAGTGKVQDETKRAWCARKQGMQEWWGNVKRHSEQLEGTLTGQIWDNLSIQTNCGKELYSIKQNRNLQGKKKPKTKQING